jgi:hypothetical protein
VPFQNKFKLTHYLAVAGRGKAGNFWAERNDPLLEKREKWGVPVKKAQPPQAKRDD